MPIKRYKGAKAKADKLFSEVIRSIGRCEDCGSTRYLQCAHIISRRFNSTRCDTRNAFSLCASCHRKYTDFPREFSKFITRTWAQDYYDFILVKARDPKAGKYVDWDERIEFLTKIKTGEMTLGQARDREGI